MPLLITEEVTERLSTLELHLH